VFVPFWFWYPTPHRSFGEGVPIRRFWRVGVPQPSLHRLMAGTPLQGTPRGTPHPFSGSGLRRRLNSYHRPERGSGGGPHRANCPRPPPPIFSRGWGGTFGQGRGGAGLVVTKVLGTGVTPEGGGIMGGRHEGGLFKPVLQASSGSWQSIGARIGCRG